MFTFQLTINTLHDPPEVDISPTPSPIGSPTKDNRASLTPVSSSRWTPLPRKSFSSSGSMSPTSPSSSASIKSRSLFNFGIQRTIAIPSSPAKRTPTSFSPPTRQDVPVIIEIKDELDEIFYELPEGLWVKPSPQAEASLQTSIVSLNPATEVDDLDDDIHLNPESCEAPQPSCSSPEKRERNFFGALISEEEIAILKDPCGWFNDNIIEWHMHSLEDRFPNPRIMILNVYFWTTLCISPGSSSLEKVSRFAPGLTPSSFDWVVIPINHGRNHWILVVAELQEKKLFIFDSMSRPKQAYTHLINKLNGWLMSVIQVKPITVYPKVPQQPDGNSCGLYICLFAEHVLKSYPNSDFESLFDHSTFQSRLIVFRQEILTDSQDSSKRLCA
jgi:hypothetical protein